MLATGLHNIIQTFTLSHDVTQHKSAVRHALYVLAYLIVLFKSRTDIRDVSIFLSPRLLSQARVFYGIWYPL